MSTIKSGWHSLPKSVRIAAYILLGILGTATVGIIIGFGIKLLWNWLMPTLFGLGTITYWQAVGLFLLAKLVFGFGMGGGSDEAKHKKARHTRCEEGGHGWAAYDAWWETQGKQAFEAYASEKGSAGNTEG